MTAAAPRRRRPAAFVVTVLLLAVVLVVAAVEAALRSWWTPPPAFVHLARAGMYVATPDGDVALLPGYRGTMPGAVPGGAPVPVAVDALGMRSDGGGGDGGGDGGSRVLVVGDERVWGEGVDAAAALPQRLQAHLRAAGRGATVGNGGVPGYGSRHMALHLARLDAAFAPDALIVCGALADDALDDVQPRRTVFAGLLLQGGWVPLVHESWRARLVCRSRAALWVEAWLAGARPQSSLLRQLRVDAAEQARAAGFVPEKLHAGLFLDVVDAKTRLDPAAPPVVQRHLDTLRASITAMREQAGERPLLFVVVPTRFHVVESRWRAELQRLGFECKRFERGLAQQRWTATAKEAGATAFDATPMLAAEPDPDALFLADGLQLSARGHDVLAAWLATVVAPLLPK